MIDYACQEEKWKLVKDGLRILKQSSERFKTLSESLLTYSRVSELQLKVTDPDKLINEVLGTVTAEAQKRAIDVQFSSKQPGNVVMDGQQMYRVLLNLVRNAMDAMEGSEGRLEIESGNVEGTAYIRVRDSGKGIAPEHLARIGEPFFTTKEDKGTGLGLAICFRIMEQHRGRIDVESTPQQGTTFTLKFPPDNTMTRHDHMAL
jgi:signal transduction histidine kinase